MSDTATKTGLDAAKTASKKVVHKRVGATGEMVGNKTSEKIVKPKLVPEANSRNFEQLIIPPEKKQEILNDLRQSLSNITLQNI